MKKTKDFIFGFLVGIVVLMAFLYGPRYMVVLGNEAEEVGKRLENYKRFVYDAAKGVLLMLNS